MTSKSPLRRALMLLPLSFVTLAACGHLTRSRATETLAPVAVAPPAAGPPAACAEFKPIIYSRLTDSLATIAQIKAHNQVYVALCGAPK